MGRSEMKAGCEWCGCQSLDESILVCPHCGSARVRLYEGGAFLPYTFEWVEDIDKAKGRLRMIESLVGRC